MEHVILIPGILRSKYSMFALARRLQKQGFSTHLWGYSTRHGTIEDIAERLAKLTSKLDGKVHFVGHSMGGLIIRAHLANHRPANLGKVVMLGTPNAGSEIADMLQRNVFYKAIYGKAGQQLTTHTKHEYKVDYPLLVIAGNKPLIGFTNRIIGKESDGTVSVESTKLDGMERHVIMPVSHTLMSSHKDVMQYVVEFLKA